MGSELEARLAQVRARQQETIQRRGKAEGQLDALRAQKSDLTAKLAGMGYESPEAAAERSKALLAETEQVLAGIEAKVKSL